MFSKLLSWIGESISTKGSAPISSFLDKEQRPGATVVTESFVTFKRSSEAIYVEGVLGAIESERLPGTFVAFAGIEVQSTEFKNLGAEGSLDFELKEAHNLSTFSVQLIVAKDELYAVDWTLPPDKNDFSINLPLEAFRKSFRGRLSEESFGGGADQIQAVRFYLKRSENLPTIKKPLEFSFLLANL